MNCRPELVSLADRGPLKAMFILTSMPVGGAETLVMELLGRFDRSRLRPEVCCLKTLDALGEAAAREVPAFSGLLVQKHDFGVLRRLVELLRWRKIDAVVTVGPGDKMFWGRLAAWRAGVPVICSALHSMGMPDHVELPNRLIARLTDAFIATAATHARWLVEHEGCPAERVRVIHNGVDVEKFHPRWPSRRLREELGLGAGTHAVGIVAALRPEKNHELFLRAAALVKAKMPDARFLVVGDGPLRGRLEGLAAELGLGEAVSFLGTRSDVAEVLSLVDVVALSSHMEANPVSILEALASEKPVVATRVGSVPETVLDGRTGRLVPPGDATAFGERLLELLSDPARAAEMGRAGREHVLAHWSIRGTVEGYQDLIEEIYASKVRRAQGRTAAASATRPAPAGAGEGPEAGRSLS